MVTLAALSLQRARVGRRRLSNGFRAFQPFRLADDLARCQALKPRRCRSSLAKATAPRHRADTCAVAPSIGTLPPHRWPDSSALPPLHSISLQLRRLRFRSIRSDGHKLPRPARTAARPEVQDSNGRDAPHIDRSAIWPRDFAYRRRQQQ